ncbi:MAG: ABC transporter permease [Culicoidibacterales bacterium]
MWSKQMKTFKRNRTLFMLTLPATIWYFVFAYLPMVGVLLAFKRYRVNGGFFNSLFTSEWVWFDNFKFLFSSSDAWLITRNTVLYNIVFIVLGIVLPILLAIGINELLNKRLAKFYQSMLFLPYFISWVVVSYFVYAFLSPESGWINGLLTQMGSDPISWYSEAKYWPFIIIFMGVWKTLGYNIVVYLAAICGIDQTYYEAAMLDGATKWQQIRYITIPLLKPVIIILFILAVGRIFNADFGLFYQVTRDSGALYSVTNVIDTYVYRGLMTLGEVGMSSAAALYQSAVGLVLILITNKIIKKIDKDQALF